MGKLSVFTMGHTGVVLDPQGLEPLPEDALERAQNAIQDPRDGHGGAVRKRAGLMPFNILYAGGAILGGIPMPVAGFGGAPAFGGGAIIGTGDVDDGTSTGTGNMTGAPGATFDGAAVATTPAGAAIFGGGDGAGGGTILFSGARLIVIGRIDGSDNNTGGVGWFVGPKSMTANSVYRATPAQGSVYNFPAVTPFSYSFGVAGCIDTIGTTGLYYAGNIGNQVTGLTAPTVYRTNGGINTLVTTLPRATQNAANINGAAALGLVSFTFASGGSGYTNGDTITLSGGTGSAATLTKTANGIVLADPGNYSVVPTNPITLTGGTGSGTIIGAFGPNPVRNAIVDMHYGSDGFVYLCVKDKYTGQNTAGSVGRVIRLSPLSGDTVEWNLGTTDGPPELFSHLPYCSCYFDGKLYVGTFPDALSESASVFASNGSSAVAETSFSPSGRASAYGFLSCMRVYNGRLFLGTGDWNAAPAFATLWSRRPGDLVSGGIVAWASSLVASGTGPGNGNFFCSMTEFQGSLYASWYGGDAAGSGRIYKVTANAPGDPTSTSFTTSIVLSQSYPFRLWVDDGVMYAIAEDTFAGAPSFITTDGTTWTDTTGRLPATGGPGSNGRPRAVFFGVNQ